MRPVTQRVLQVVGAAIFRDGRCLAAQRSAAMAAPLKWEFPGGKVEPTEDPRDALRRELREELQVEVSIGAWIARGEAEAADRLIRLDVYAAEIESGEVRPREHAHVGWFDASGLEGLDWAAPDVPVVMAVLRLLGAARPGIAARAVRTG
jgi:8-oxo-dGTP diphosphatase